MSEQTKFCIKMKRNGDVLLLRKFDPNIGIDHIFFHNPLYLVDRRAEDEKDYYIQGTIMASSETEAVKKMDAIRHKGIHNGSWKKPYSSGLLLYDICMLRDGKVVSCAEIDYSITEVQPYLGTQREPVKVTRLFGRVWAKDKKGAISDMDRFRKQLIAEGGWEEDQ